MNEFVTNSLALAAYLLSKGVTIKKATGGRPFVFIFDDENDVCDQLAIDFLNSESSKFDDAMKKLKIMLKN